MKQIMNKQLLSGLLFAALLPAASMSSYADTLQCSQNADCPEQQQCDMDTQQCVDKDKRRARKRGAMSDHDAVRSMPYALETDYPLPENGERLFPMETFIFWGLPDATGQMTGSDEVRYTTHMVKETVAKQLENPVDNVQFVSGRSNIPDGLVAKLAEVLQGLKTRDNVRLHFVGHTDNQGMSAKTRAIYGNNQGLSVARAKKVAQYFQRELGLPGDAVSWDGKGESQPIGDNNTAAGMRLNRRVEVQVWYDETVEREEQVVDIPQPGEMTRTRVCHVQTMCRPRTTLDNFETVEIKNVIDPIRFKTGDSRIPPEHVEKLKQVLAELGNKSNLQLIFVGHTDNQGMSAKTRKIYGDNQGLSEARAQRVADYFRQVLGLPSGAVLAEGKGATEPVASNGTAGGRALNRRVEVQVRYDEVDANQTVVEGDLEWCPEERSAGGVTTETYYESVKYADPLEPVRFASGKHQIPDEYVEQLRILLNKLQDKKNLHLRFVGHTDADRLSPPTKKLYGDNKGLSLSRAKRVMEYVQDKLHLPEQSVSYDGKGKTEPLASNDKESGKRLNRRVEVEIWYDEPRQREVRNEKTYTEVQVDSDPRDAFSLSPFRITLDGRPLEQGEGVHTADVQRCVDVALEKAEVQLQYDNLSIKPRLNVNAWPSVIAYRDDEDTERLENLTHFTGYSNYSAYFERAEVRIFAMQQSLQEPPILIVPMDEDLKAEWQFNADVFSQLPSTLKYVLRVYDKDNRFDETKAQRLSLMDTVEPLPEDTDPVAEEQWVGYGESSLAVQNIVINSGTITVNGKDVPAGHKVYVMGEEVPLGKNGRFVSQQIIPDGYHTIEVAVLDEEGNGELFHRDLEFTESDWFYVGIADLTLGLRDVDGPASTITQDDRYDDDSYIDGRLAFYVKGKTESNWNITASADTREQPLEDLFHNFASKDPLILFRRFDPDLYYPTYGDDSTLEEDAPTQGKFYIKAEKNKSFGLWGNFETKIHDTDLAQIDRALYGGQLHYESKGLTQYGENRTQLELFAAEPGTVSAREDYRGTGGSLYYLKHQDITLGSERIRIEVRDKDSGLVVERKTLQPGTDYDIDALQGRVMLNAPLAASSMDNLVVHNGAIAGNHNFLVITYEYTPGFDDLDDVLVGGRASHWFGDHVQLGVTGNKQEQEGAEQKLQAVDLTLRGSPTNYVKLEVAQTEGVAPDQLESIDGGFGFNNQPQGALASGDTADAARIEAGFQLGKRGRVSAYAQTREEGYSAPGQLARSDTDQIGATITYPLNDDINLTAKYDNKEEDLGNQDESLDAQVGIDLTEQWSLDVGARFDSKESNLIVATDQGERTDMAAELGYDSKKGWTAYLFGQGTLDHDDTRDINNRGGVGGSYQIADRLSVDGEVSGGNTGTGAQIGTDYQATDRTNIYAAFALENQRSNTGIRGRRGNLTGGFKSRYSDTLSIFGEERYAYGDQPVGLTHAYGVDLAPNDRWNFGTTIEVGELETRSGGTRSTTDRLALSFNAGYSNEKTKYAGAVEFRDDETGTTSRETWLLRNQLTYQNTPDWRTLLKLNWSQSESSQGEFFDGDFTEAIWGYAYRPVDNDRFNALLKYTYFYNRPAPEQVTTSNVNSQYVQRSHVISADFNYDLTQRWTVGGKYAYRQGELSINRANPDYFESRAHLLIARADWHVVRHWDFLIEGRMLDLIDAEDSRSGFLVGVYRHFGNHLKLGLGYNFTDFSDDLTDLSYDSQGVFINIVGKI